MVTAILCSGSGEGRDKDGGGEEEGLERRGLSKAIQMAVLCLSLQVGIPSITSQYSIIFILKLKATVFSNYKLIFSKFLARSFFKTVLNYYQNLLKDIEEKVN